MIISLIGYMASGKSAVGQELARLNNYNFIDLDAFIESKEGMKIAEIFETKGEIYFRKKEGEYLKEVLMNSDNLVLSHGGGTPCYGNNLNLINTLSTSVYLKTSISTLVNRLKNGKNKRPLVAELEGDKLTEYVAKHLFERRNFYEQANYLVNADEKSVYDLAREIQELG